MRPIDTDTPLRPTNAPRTTSAVDHTPGDPRHRHARSSQISTAHGSRIRPGHPNAGRETVDNRGGVVLIAVAVGIAINNYARSSAPGFWSAWIEPATDPEFARLAWWTLSNVVFVGIAPILVARWAGWTLRDVGFGLGSLRHHVRWYAGAAAVMVPVVVTVSRLPAFQETYPFYAPTGSASYTHWLLAWWTLYGLQFVAVEGLFRGVLAVGVVRRMGLSPLTAAAFATIPYAMFHFGKPAPETFGAVVAGMALAWLAQRSNSIWGGVALHVTVALTMDIAVLGHLGIF